MTVIKLKRGTTTPTTSDIVSGEVAVDTSAQKLYINDSGTVKEIGGGSVGSIALNDLSDVSTSGATEGQVLTVQAGGSTFAFETPTAGADDSFINAIIFG